MSATMADKLVLNNVPRDDPDQVSMTGHSVLSWIV